MKRVAQGLAVAVAVFCLVAAGPARAAGLADCPVAFDAAPVIPGADRLRALGGPQATQPRIPRDRDDSRAAVTDAPVEGVAAAESPLEREELSGWVRAGTRHDGRTVALRCGSPQGLRKLRCDRRPLVREVRRSRPIARPPSLPPKYGLALHHFRRKSFAK